jgi:hypothetical protein
MLALPLHGMFLESYLRNVLPILICGCMSSILCASVVHRRVKPLWLSNAPHDTQPIKSLATNQTTQPSQSTRSRTQEHTIASRSPPADRGMTAPRNRWSLSFRQRTYVLASPDFAEQTRNRISESIKIELSRRNESWASASMNSVLDDGSLLM